MLLWLGCTLSYGQQSVPSSGGNGSGSGGSVSYSIGQTVYTTNTGSGGNVSQGVQQVYQIVTLINDELASKMSLNVYPNPTTDLLVLQLDLLDKSNLNYQLIDMQGNLKFSNSINNHETLIDASTFSSGTYLLNILNKNVQIQSFKIIKK